MGWYKAHTVNLVEGIGKSDAVCVSQIPNMNKGEWDFNNIRLVNVQNAMHANDCVTRKQILVLATNGFLPIIKE